MFSPWVELCVALLFSVSIVVSGSVLLVAMGSLLGTLVTLYAPPLIEF